MDTPIHAIALDDYRSLAIMWLISTYHLEPAHMKKDPRTQRQRVIEEIQRAILEGALQPGDRLPQIQLAQQYGVSQSVIRESLQTLEQYCLVAGANQKGFVVREFDQQGLVDAYRVREVLEGLAARLCCRKANRDDVEWLESTAKQIHASSKKGNRLDRSDLEYQFHQRLLSIAGNEMLARVSFGYRFVGNLVTTGRSSDELLEEHLAVVAAIAANKPEEAERLARLHVARSADSIISSKG
jgi:DNA-binding GntR family transcriptional regulator